MNWEQAKADEKLAIVREINKVEPVYKFNPDDSVVETLGLPFYPGGKLLCISKPLPIQPTLWYVRLPAETIALDGSVANIHYLNDRAPVVLTAQTIADYLKFRLYFAGGAWLEGVVAAETPEGFVATARVLEKDARQEKKFRVSRRGELTLQSKQKLGEGGRVPDKFGL